ncbi:hypothetical protein PTMSG1_02410 [Pyrenophora teres f. maculata]|nr:hypothetical protein PTMSG1_02410 [Pyrenophora teres f. maculata]
MVLYHANGRVVIAHEAYLENLAQQAADSKKYVDQVHDYNRRNAPPHNGNQVEIIIEMQRFRTVWSHREGSDWEYLNAFNHDQVRIRHVDRATLRFVSSLADDHFRCNPGAHQISLPVRYPRMHIPGTSGWSDEGFAESYPQVIIPGLRLAYTDDSHMAYIRSEEITKFIIPWLGMVKEIVNPGKHNKGKGPADVPNQQNPTPSAPITLPQIQMPEDLLGRIHLYNAMLQLGLPKPIQKPLIDALVLQMYQTNLNACHLDALEMTVGRFYARGLPILDPVLNHFAGTYAFRRPEDRRNPGSTSLKTHNEEEPPPTIAKRGFTELDRADGSPPSVSAEVDFRISHRKYLNYAAQPVTRQDVNDTYELPPVLPVLGQTIRHWTGVRKNGSTAAAFTGFPLNIGKGKRFTRTPTVARTEEETVTHHLIHQEAYLRNDPGYLSA